MDNPPPSFVDGDPGRVLSVRPEGFEKLVTDLILAWASFDTGLLFLITEVFEMPVRNARVMVGNMEIKGKIAKIKDLAAVAGFDQLQKLMTQWETGYYRAVVPRNAVCHMHYFGVMPDKPERYVFGLSKAAEGKRDSARLLVLDREYFDFSIEWANQKTTLANDVQKALRELPLSQFEEDPRANHPHANENRTP